MKPLCVHQVAQGIRRLEAKLDSVAAAAAADLTPPPPQRSKGADDGHALVAEGHGGALEREPRRGRPVGRPAGGSFVAGPSELPRPSLFDVIHEICATGSGVQPQSASKLPLPAANSPPCPAGSAPQPTDSAPPGNDGSGVAAAGGGSALPPNDPGAGSLGAEAEVVTAGAAAAAAAGAGEGEPETVGAQVAEVGQRLDALADSLSRKLERIAYALGIRNLAVVDNSGDDEARRRGRRRGQGVGVIGKLGGEESGVWGVLCAFKRVCVRACVCA